MPLTKSLKIACCEIGEMHECVSNFVESKGVYFYLFKSKECVSKIDWERKRERKSNSESLKC